ncbi:MAG TPA: glycosyltransferase family 4 protein [Stellaceae bacterium]|nr:glycosyltransferase family 4 protein [Stellaceae bacterium]
MPLYRELARRCDLTVFFAHRATAADQAKAGFGIGFDWDADLFSGYVHVWLRNVARRPGLDQFFACDTPEIGLRLTEGHFDAVLVQGWHFKAYLQAIFAAKRLRLPVLARGDSHLDTPRSALRKAGKVIAYPMFLRLFDAALYVGKRSRLYWAHYHYPKTRMFFSPHSIDAEWFAARATDQARRELRAQLNIAPDAKVALFAGKLVPYKRPLDLIAAAGRSKGEGHEIQIIVAGTGPLEAEMLAAARALKVSIHALGFCNQTKMPCAYAAADVLVLPSDARETWGLVANEALACGRPIILSDAVGAAPDLAVDEMAGRVFPVGDIANLAGALHAILDCPPRPEVIAAKSHAYRLGVAVDGIEAALSTISTRTRGRRVNSSTILR